MQQVFFPSELQGREVPGDIHMYAYIIYRYIPHTKARCVLKQSHQEQRLHPSESGRSPTSQSASNWTHLVGKAPLNFVLFTRQVVFKNLGCLELLIWIQHSTYNKVTATTHCKALALNMSWRVWIKEELVHLKNLLRSVGRTWWRYLIWGCHCRLNSAALQHAPLSQDHHRQYLVLNKRLLMQFIKGQPEEDSSCHWFPPNQFSQLIWFYFGFGVFNFVMCVVYLFFEMLHDLVLKPKFGMVPNSAASQD